MNPSRRRGPLVTVSFDANGLTLVQRGTSVHLPWLTVGHLQVEPDRGVVLVHLSDGRVLSLPSDSCDVAGLVRAWRASSREQVRSPHDAIPADFRAARARELGIDTGRVRDVTPDQPVEDARPFGPGGASGLGVRRWFRRGGS